jgi:hypothetical protein
MLVNLLIKSGKKIIILGGDTGGFVSKFPHKFYTPYHFCFLMILHELKITLTTDFFLEFFYKLTLHEKNW